MSCSPVNKFPFPLARYKEESDTPLWIVAAVVFCILLPFGTFSPTVPFGWGCFLLGLFEIVLLSTTQGLPPLRPLPLSFFPGVPRPLPLRTAVSGSRPRTPGGKLTPFLHLFHLSGNFPPLSSLNDTLSQIIQLF